MSSACPEILQPSWHLTTCPVPCSSLIDLLGTGSSTRSPASNKLHADPETIQKRFGIFGELMMVGFMLGMPFKLAGYSRVFLRSPLILVRSCTSSRAWSILHGWPYPLSRMAKDFPWRGVSLTARTSIYRSGHCRGHWQPRDHIDGSPDPPSPSSLLPRSRKSGAPGR